MVKTDRSAEGKRGTINQQLSELPHLVLSDVSSAFPKAPASDLIALILLRDSGHDCMFHSISQTKDLTFISVRLFVL